MPRKTYTANDIALQQVVNLPKPELAKATWYGVVERNLFGDWVIHGVVKGDQDKCIGDAKASIAQFCCQYNEFSEAHYRLTFTQKLS